MIGITIANPKSFAVAAAKAIARLEQHTQEVFRGFAVTAFQRVVSDTPQWSGNAAASWNFSIGSPDFGTDSAMLARDPADIHADPFKVHDQPAFHRAMERNLGHDKDVKLTSTVFITNSAESLSGKAYIQKLEDNPNDYLRPENEGGGMVKKTVDSMNSDFQTVTANMSRQLKSVKIGGKQL